MFGTGEVYDKLRRTLKACVAHVSRTRGVNARTDPIDLLTEVISIQSAVEVLARTLMEKGVITPAEYENAMNEAMDGEVSKYERMVGIKRE
jgi:hypothetical protein